MRTSTWMTALVAGLLLVAPIATAQRPGGPGDGNDDLAARMMAFDADKDGKLTRAEVTDARLLGLFDRADADKDGTVTQAELTALAARERGTPRGFGGPGGMMGGPPRPGEVLPPMLQQRLRLSPEQKAQLAELQKEVDARLAKILDDEQRAQLEQMRNRGPGRPPGGRGGPGGPPPGGPGGPPPDGPPPG